MSNVNILKNWCFDEIFGFLKILLGDAIKMRLLVDILNCDIYPKLAPKKNMNFMHTHLLHSNLNIDTKNRFEKCNLILLYTQY
jgi:hypothetical protein